MANKNKELALAKHLGVDKRDVAQSICGKTFFYEKQNWLVLTDAQATEAAKKCIRESLWAFNYDFLCCYFDLKVPRTQALKVSVIAVQQKLCEAANEVIYAMVRSRYTQLVRDAITADGRGHFLASYDGAEHTQTIENVTYFLYRLD